MAHSTAKLETIEHRIVELNAGTGTELRNRAPSNNKRSAEGALPKINNQNTVIMRAATQPSEGNKSELMLMHNTRIFYFQRDPEILKSKTESIITRLDEAADIMTDDINGL